MSNEKIYFNLKTQKHTMKEPAESGITITESEDFFLHEYWLCADGTEVDVCYPEFMIEQGEETLAKIRGNHFVDKIPVEMIRGEMPKDMYEDFKAMAERNDAEMEVEHNDEQV